MKNIGKLLILAAGIFGYRRNSNVKIMYTAALLDRHFEARKQEYIHSLEILSQLGCEAYIVEAIKKVGPTFFDEYCSNVFYAQSNNPRLRNKGINEASTMLEGCNHFDFEDEDMIIKLSGRYYFESDLLFEAIKEHPGYDAFARFDRHGQVHACCFAMRYKYFKHMLEQLNFANMEKRMINIEREIANYLKKYSIKTLQLEKLGVAGKVYGTGASFNNAILKHW